MDDGCPVQRDGVAREVAHQHVEDRVDRVGVEVGQRSLLEDQLSVDDEREELAQGEQEAELALLLLAWRGGAEQRAEALGLLHEAGDVRHVGERRVARAPVVELDLPEALGRPLAEQELVVGRVAPLRHRRVLGRVEQVVGHELQDQRHVHVHGALELRQPADVARGHLEERVLLEALGGDHVPEVVDHLLALGGHLHLRDRVEEQIAAVVGARRAEVVDRPVAEQLHRHQARVGVGQQLADVRETR